MLGVAKAATLTFATGVIGTDPNGDVEIPLSGQTVVDAYVFSQSLANSMTLEGVSFTAANVTSSTGTFGNVSVSEVMGGYNAFSSPSSAWFDALSANYQSFLAGGVYGPGSNILTNLITVSDLTVGDSYSVRLWTNANDASTGYIRIAQGDNTDNNVVVNTGDDQSNNGTYVTATFIADSATESFSFSSSANPLINAIEVVDLTAVPEPSTVALLGCGAGLALLAFRRRFQAARA